jgi:LysM repeat protein
VVHRVRKGETLARIAKKYGVSVAQLSRSNRMGKKSQVRVGQKLRINRTTAGGDDGRLQFVQTNLPTTVVVPAYAAAEQSSVSSLVGNTTSSTSSASPDSTAFDESTNPVGDASPPAITNSSLLASNTTLDQPKKSKRSKSKRAPLSDAQMAENQQNSGVATIIKNSGMASDASQPEPTTLETPPQSTASNPDWNEPASTETVSEPEAPVNASSAGNASPPAATTKTGAGGTFIVHQVRSGDNLWRIAKRYGVTVQQIIKWNNLGSSQLKAKQRLKIARKS